jgi:hypothetical protein
MRRAFVIAAAVALVVAAALFAIVGSRPPGPRVSSAAPKATGTTAASGHGPSARSGAGLAYFSVRTQVLLVGAQDGSGQFPIARLAR